MNRWDDDHYTKLAKKKKYRSRSAFKLLEIFERERLTVKNKTIIDLGGAPGGWSQVCVRQGAEQVICVDLKVIDPIEKVQAIVGDICQEETWSFLQELSQTPLPMVICDIAPDLTGVKIADAVAAADLNYMVAEKAANHLAPDGTLIMKVFQGSEFEFIRANLLASFSKLKFLSVKASRKTSSEVFAVARFPKGN